MSLAKFFGVYSTGYNIFVTIFALSDSKISAVDPVNRRMPKRILSVSYDEPLLMTREMLLRRQGYEVTSALGYIDAIQSCKPAQFDLLILGHSIPENDKKQLMTAFRAVGAAPVLALRRHGEVVPDDADAHVYPDDIDALLDTVDSILKPDQSSTKKQ